MLLRVEADIRYTCRMTLDVFRSIRVEARRISAQKRWINHRIVPVVALSRAPTASEGSGFEEAGGLWEAVLGGGARRYGAPVEVQRRLLRSEMGVHRPADGPTKLIRVVVGVAASARVTTYARAPATRRRARYMAATATTRLPSTLRAQPSIIRAQLEGPPTYTHACTPTHMGMPPACHGHPCTPVTGTVHPRTHAHACVQRNASSTHAHPLSTCTHTLGLPDCMRVTFMGL